MRGIDELPRMGPVGRYCSCKAKRPRQLLLFLAEHRGRVVSREQILAQVWGYDFFGGTRTVDVHVRWLREKIEVNPAEPRRLQKVRGVGYRFDE
jgi:DNA-binding response OmpR family regulator